MGIQVDIIICLEDGGSVDITNVGGAIQDAVMAELDGLLDDAEEAIPVKVKAKVREWGNIMDFKIDDIVEQNGFSDCLVRVVGVIHDEQRLFVIDDSGRSFKGKEFEICFAEVTGHWQRKE